VASYLPLGFQPSAAHPSRRAAHCPSGPPTGNAHVFRHCLVNEGHRAARTFLVSWRYCSPANPNRWRSHGKSVPTSGRAHHRPLARPRRRCLAAGRIRAMVLGLGVGFPRSIRRSSVAKFGAGAAGDQCASLPRRMDYRLGPPAGRISPIPGSSGLMGPRLLALWRRATAYGAIAPPGFPPGRSKTALAREHWR